MSEVLTVLDNLEDSEVRLINDIIQRYFKLYKKEFGKDLSHLERDLFVMLGHIHLKEWKFDLVKMKHTRDERLFLYDMSGMSKRSFTFGARSFCNAGSYTFKRMEI